MHGSLSALSAFVGLLLCGEPLYRSPWELEPVPGQPWVVVANQRAGTVALVDVEAGQVVREVTVGQEPLGLACQENRLAVACRFSDEVVLLRLPDLAIVARWPVPNQPYDLVWDKAGRLWISCSGKDELVVALDPATGKIVHRLEVPQNPKHLALSQDGQRLFVACDRYDLTRELVIIELSNAKVVGRYQLKPAANLRDVAEVAPGWVAVAHVQPKPFVPLTQVRQGWVQTNVVSLIHVTAPSEPPRTLLLDDPHRYYANPHGLASDGRRLFVTCAGVDELLVYDLRAFLAGSGPAADYVPLGASARYRQAVVPVGRNPHDVVYLADRQLLLVADRLSDGISVVDAQQLVRVTTVQVGKNSRVTRLRRGEILFNSAQLCFQRQFSCASCHPEGHTTGLSWDLEDDGLGNVKNIRSFRGVAGTGPFRWQGEAAKVGANECGPTVTLAMRGEPLSKDDLAALEAFVLSVPPVPNPYRLPDGSLTEAAKRGKAIFEGKARCAKCHSGPKLTNRKRRDVGTGVGRYEPLRLPNGRVIHPSQFDVPQLIGLWDSPPYLHDGRARTLREVLTTYNPDDKHGKTSQLTPQELDDLIAYLLSL